MTLNNEFRLLNHSCDPNCGISVNETGAHDLIARRGIVSGEEITFDYAMQNYEISHFPAVCKCGANGCRGEIRGWKYLSTEQKDSLREWAAPYLFDLDVAAGQNG